MTVHAPYLSHSRTVSEVSVAWSVPPESRKFLLLILHVWKRRSAAERERWRKRVVLAASARFQGKQSIFQAWRREVEVQRERKVKSEYCNNRLFDKVTVGRKVDSFFGWVRAWRWRRQVEILRSRVRRTRRSEMFSGWLVVSRERSSLRASNNMKLLRCQFKFFRRGLKHLENWNKKTVRSRRLECILTTRLARGLVGRFASPWANLARCLRSNRLKLRALSRRILEVWLIITQLRISRKSKLSRAALASDRRVWTNFFSAWAAQAARAKYRATVDAVRLHRRVGMRRVWRVWTVDVKLLLRVERGLETKALFFRFTKVVLRALGGWGERVSALRTKRALFEMRKHLVGRSVVKGNFPEFLARLRFFRSESERVRTVGRLVVVRLQLRSLLRWLLCSEAVAAARQLERRAILKFGLRRLGRCARNSRELKLKISTLLQLKFFSEWISAASRFGRLADRMRADRVGRTFACWKSLKQRIDRAVEFSKTSYLVPTVFGAWKGWIGKRTLLATSATRYALLCKKKCFLSFVRCATHVSTFRRERREAHRLFKEHTLRKGIPRLLAALTVWEDKRTAALTTWIHRQFLLGKRVVRRWINFSERFRKARALEIREWEARQIELREYSPFQIDSTHMAPPSLPISPSCLEAIQEKVINIRTHLQVLARN